MDFEMKALFALLALFMDCSANALSTERINLSTEGVEATGGNSFASTTSADGNLVVFSSLANNLDPLDTNTVTDIYLKNRSTGSLTLVSRGPNGVGDASSSNPVISADGSTVVFASAATNLIANDTNGVVDVFAYYVAFGGIQRISESNASIFPIQGNGASGSCASNCFSVSDDGRYIAFESLASNFSSIDTDSVSDIYVRDRIGQATILISQTTLGSLGSGPLGSNKPAISGNGRFVIFESSRVLETADTNNTGDIYLRDIQSNSTTRVNTSATGAATTTGFSARPSISRDGTIVAFRSVSNELVPGDSSPISQRDVFVKNLNTGAIRRAEIPGGGDPNGDSNEAFISGDGASLVFHSAASNFVPTDSNGVEDVFLMRINTGTIERLSLTSTNIQAIGASTFPKCNADCSKVVYESSATNLVAGDTNTRTDIFLTTLNEDLLFRNGFE
jgi:Tol biopolymer transport system component